MKLFFSRLRSQARSVVPRASCTVKVIGPALPLAHPESRRMRTVRNTALAMMLFLFATINAASAVSISIPSGGVTGTVTDALGRPLSNVSVELRSSNGKVVSRGETNRDGNFQLPLAKAGAYTLVTHKRGFKPATRFILLPDNKTSVNLVLEAQEALNVPIKANRIRAQNGLSRAGNSKYTMTAEDISNLPAGEATPLNDVLLQMPGVALDQNQ